MNLAEASLFTCLREEILAHDGCWQLSLRELRFWLVQGRFSVDAFAVLFAQRYCIDIEKDRERCALILSQVRKQ